MEQVHIPCTFGSQQQLDHLEQSHWLKSFQKAAILSEAFVIYVGCSNLSNFRIITYYHKIKLCFMKKYEYIIQIITRVEGNIDFISAVGMKY